MELTLNIYGDKGAVVKTYTANDFTLKTGVCEDIVNMIDIDRMIDGQLSEQQMGLEIIKIVAKSFSKFRPFLQDVFVGLTDEEYRNTSIKDVAGVIIQIITYTIAELSSIGGTKKK